MSTEAPQPAGPADDPADSPGNGSRLGDYTGNCDAEDLEIARLWWRDFELWFKPCLDFRGHIGCQEAYRKFSAPWKRVRSVVQNYTKPPKAWPGLVLGSWGHFTLDVLLQLKQFVEQNEEMEYDGNSVEDCLQMLISHLEGRFVPDGFYHEIFS